MRKNYLLVSAAALLIIVAALFFRSSKTENPSAAITPPEVKTETGFSPQTSDENGVEVTAVPEDLQTGALRIALSTHSVDLLYDLTKIAVLRDETGREYKPLRWEGSVPGGHHREGILFFGRLSPESRKIELVLYGVADTPERRFSWTTNQ